MKKTYLLFFIFCFSAIGFAQYSPGVNNNVTLLSHWDSYDVYSNIWGFVGSDGKEYAIIGHNQGTSFVDISDPSQPVERDMLPGPSANGTIWREIKTYDNYAYIVSEHTQPNSMSGVQIVDLSFLPDSVHLVTNYRWPGVTASNAKVHSVTVDVEHALLIIQGGTSTQGIAGGDPGGIRILSLATPSAPVSRATLPVRYAHDTYVRNNLLFASNIYEGGHIDIWNIADFDNINLIHSITYPNGFSHNSGISEDNNYLYSTDEVTGATVKTFRIENLWDADTSNDSEIDLTSEYIGDATQIAHNIHVKGSRAYLSHYAEGVKILDLSYPHDPVEVGYYDTYHDPDNGFVGAWGVYPYFNSGSFIVSDIQTGLYVMKFDEIGRGSILGTVYNSQTGDTIENAKLFFLEANKTLYTNENGFYQMKTSASFHTITISATGYFPTTTTLTLPQDDPYTLDIALQPENAFISLSRDSIGVVLDVDSASQEHFDISNTGNGTLRFTVDDVNGSQGNKSFTKYNPKNFNRKIFQSVRNARWNESVVNSNFKKEMELLVSDPSNDVIGASGKPDIQSLFGEKNDESITLKMKYYHPVNPDSETIGYALDTDQNPETGSSSIGIYLGDVGAEYDVFVTIPPIPWFGIPANTVLIFDNIAGGNPMVIPNAATVETDSSITISISLSSLGNDDGNINIAGSSYHWADSLGIYPPTTLDFIPNEGHTSLGIDPIGDVPWCSFNGEDFIRDSIVGMNSRRIFVNFDATGLEEDETFRGILKILSNDPNNTELHIPIVLETNEIVGVNERLQPYKFSLAQNYPNPFNPTTEIIYSLASPQTTTLKIYNLLGEEVATLVDNFQHAGNYNLKFNASKFSSGMYFYKLTSGNFVDMKKMLLMK